MYIRQREEEVEEEEEGRRISVGIHKQSCDSPALHKCTHQFSECSHNDWIRKGPVLAGLS